MKNSSVGKFVIVCLSICVLVLSAYSVNSWAVNGTLSFTHGVSDPYYTGGSISSSAVESSLRVAVSINSYLGYSFHNGQTSYQTSYADNWVNASGQSGSSSCTYYCNGRYVASSSAPWYFDFRR